MASVDVCERQSSEDVEYKQELHHSRSADNIGEQLNMETKSVTLISALHSKYSASSMQSTHCIIFMAPNAPGKTASGNFRVPENLTLNSFNITSAGRKDDISRMCADVIELDLTENKIRSWSEVFTALDCLPKLDFLNLTKNPLEELTIVNGHSYPNLKKLALNFTNLSWNSIQNLLKVLPNLEELYLSGNCYEDVTLQMSPYSTLHLLQLTSNKLSDWTNVVKLDRLFPNLENLILAYNNIVDCGSEEANSLLFQNLRILNMNNTNVSEWNELDKLSCIKSLCDIRLGSIPLLEKFDNLKKRQLLSVYFPHVERLNGSTLKVDEREAAERVFIRHFLDQNVKPKRCSLLEQKHGKLDPLASINLTPKETVTLTVVCGDKEEVFDIPSKWTVGQLRRSLKSFTGSSKFRLFHQANDGHGPNQIKQTNRFIWALNFMDGEKLFCDVDPASPLTPPASPLTPPASPLTPPASPDGLESVSSSRVPPSPTKEPPLKRR